MLLREICSACFTNCDKHTLQIHLIAEISNDDIDAVLTRCREEKKIQHAMNG